MADPYQLCPGGTGKKVKFCCPDLVNELDKLERLIEGGQRQAALEKINALEAKHPNRACLMTLKAGLFGALGQAEAAEAVIDQILEKIPENAVALSESAVLAAEKSDGRKAVEMALASLRAATQETIQTVTANVLNTVQLLMEQEHMAAGRHLLTMAVATGLTNERATAILQMMMGDPTMSLVFKEDFRFPRRTGAPWQAEVDAIESLINQLEWVQAEAKLAELASRYPDEPRLARCLGILRLALANERGAIEAFRRGVTPNTPIDDAVDLELFAQQVEAVHPGDEQRGGFIELLRQTFDISDFDAVLAALTKSPRVVRLPGDPAQWSADSDRDLQTHAPRPKAAFRLLDRPALQTAEGATIDSLPQSLGEVFLYSRETDREPRIELRALRDHLHEAGTALAELCGEAFRGFSGERVVARLPAEGVATFKSFVPPADTPKDLLRGWVREEQRRLYLEEWPKAPNSRLGGQSVEEVARQPDGAVRALAAIRGLELSLPSADFDAAALRDRLGLPQPTPRDPEGQNPLETPYLVLLAWDVSRASDEQLLTAFEILSLQGIGRGVEKFGRAILDRTSLHEKIPIDEVYHRLVTHEQDIDRAFEIVAEARTNKDASCALWDLTEFNLLINAGRGAELQKMLRHIMEQHAQEEGILEATYEIMARNGLLPPEGMQGMQGPRAGQPDVNRSILTSADSATPGGVWTPGAPAAAPSEKKPTIWTPGMD